jgi:S-adenosylmethionine:tRNA ribosyltransferase-isomerase
MGLTRADLMYDLPPGLIAGRPCRERTGSRLMHLPLRGGRPVGMRFADLPGLLREGDLLVLNNTRVIRARLRGTRPTGGAVEVMLLERLEGPSRWRVMLRPSRRAAAGLRLSFRGELSALVESTGPPGRAVVAFESAGGTDALVSSLGEVPLPPYLGRPADSMDEERYQTVFASVEGAVAAPTAGLHFDRDLLEAIRSRGVGVEELTLHVGPGTFEPLRHDEIDRNTLEEERYDVGESCAAAVASAVAGGRRVIAVGTTSARVLESLGPAPRASTGSTSLFIRPPYAFGVISGLITNFHLPGTSLLCLVAALAGLERTLAAYGQAVSEGYRFYSYGDAMIVL